MRDFPIFKVKVKEVNQSPQGGLALNSPKRNHFYALGSRGEDLSGFEVSVSLSSFWWMCLCYKMSLYVLVSPIVIPS